MSIKVMTWYWSNSEQEGHKLLALLALSDWASDEGDCYPSVATLAQRIRRKRRATQVALKELENAGEIVIYPGMGKGPDGMRSSLYYLIKYREAHGIAVPPMIAEAASHYRKKDREQGRKGYEIRKLQASLGGAADDTPPGAADDTPPVQPTTPPGCSPLHPEPSVDPSLEPSVDPSGARGASAEASPPASPALTTASPAQAEAPKTEPPKSLLGNDSYDMPPSSKRSSPRSGRSPSRMPKAEPYAPDGRYFDSSKVQNGYIPADTGTTAVEVYYERHAVKDHVLTRPHQDDMMRKIKDLDLWRAAVTEWSTTGNRANNIKGMFDWYDHPERMPSNKYAASAKVTQKGATHEHTAKPVTEDPYARYAHFGKAKPPV